MSHGNRNLTQNIFQCHMENEISVKIFSNVTWKMKLLLHATVNITLLMGKYWVIFSLAKYLWSFATYLWMMYILQIVKGTIDGAFRVGCKKRGKWPQAKGKACRCIFKICPYTEKKNNVVFYVWWYIKLYEKSSNIKWICMQLHFYYLSPGSKILQKECS